MLSEGCLPYLIGGGVVAATAIVLLLRRSRNEKNYLVDAPNDTVVLRQLPRGPYAPNLSPFPLKLETYFRMAKIPYQSVTGMTMSPKTKKTPWAQLNGEILTDSQFIIEHVNKHFKVDTMSHLSASDRAVARAFQKMVDESTYWTGARWRWEFDSTKFMTEKCKVPSIAVKMVRRTVQKQLYQQGTGRFTKDQVLCIFRKDLEALSVYLGDKKFLMGNEPCEVDCSLFGILAQVKWQTPDSPINKMMDDYPNLHAYCNRIKETFWPDWDECITHGGTREATK